MKHLLTSGLLAIGLAAGSPIAAQDTIRFAVTDIDGMEALQREMGPFKDAFEAASGLKVEFFPVSGRTVAVEAMAAEQVDFVLTGPAEYVVFNARLDAQPVVTWVRPDYYSSVVVLDESPVRTTADLMGQMISFGEIGSTSQHLGPVDLLAKAGLTYAVDYQPVFLNRNVAVEALIKGEIAGIGLNRTHIDSITEKFPDQRFRVLVKGEQDIHRPRCGDPGSADQHRREREVCRRHLQPDRDQRRLRRGAQDVREHRHHRVHRIRRRVIP
jgi:phosphonate transport system substrate-binding protein